MQQLLIVHWMHEKEFISFDEDENSFSQLETTGRWRYSSEVIYNVSASLTQNGPLRTLNLTYISANQTDPIVKSQAQGRVRYGVSVIEWRKGKFIGKAKWKDNEGQHYDGTAQVSVLGGGQLDTAERAKRSVIHRPRPKQSMFRDALFQLDKGCVLTGERCHEALQAAHLLPVASNGHEQIENGLLLRADLHLLLDAGLLWFDVSDDHAAVKLWTGDLMGSYAALLKGKNLPPKTFQRVKAALLARAKLPGGCGKNAPT